MQLPCRFTYPNVEIPSRAQRAFAFQYVQHPQASSEKAFSSVLWENDGAPLTLHYKPDVGCNKNRNCFTGRRIKSVETPSGWLIVAPCYSDIPRGISAPTASCIAERNHEKEKYACCKRL